MLFGLSSPFSKYLRYSSSSYDCGLGLNNREMREGGVAGNVNARREKGELVGED